MGVMVETLQEMIQDKTKELKVIEAVMVEKYKNNEDYKKELDQCQMLKAEIEEAMRRLHREIKTEQEQK